jgi:hypothetical protein
VAARPSNGKPAVAALPADKPEAKILFQTYFKSVGPRTYAAQVKLAGNGNHFLVLTEGRRDDATGEVRKSRVFVFSEDFVAFFRQLQEIAQFIRGHPVSDEVKQKRQRYWARKNGDGGAAKGSPESPRPAPTPAAPPRPAARRR